MTSKKEKREAGIRLAHSREVLREQRRQDVIRKGEAARRRKAKRIAEQEASKARAVEAARIHRAASERGDSAHLPECG